MLFNKFRKNTRPTATGHKDVKPATTKVADLKPDTAPDKNQLTASSLVQTQQELFNQNASRLKDVTPEAEELSAQESVKSIDKQLLEFAKSDPIARSYEDRLFPAHSGILEASLMLDKKYNFPPDTIRNKLLGHERRIGDLLVSHYEQAGFTVSVKYMKFKNGPDYLYTMSISWT